MTLYIIRTYVRMYVRMYVFLSFCHKELKEKTLQNCNYIQNYISILDNLWDFFFTEHD